MKDLNRFIFIQLELQSFECRERVVISSRIKLLAYLFGVQVKKLGKSF